MTEKEKAKAYDEALKKASAAHKDEDKHLKATLERIFPELKEDDDEKIKKDLIQWVDEFPDTIWRGHYKEDIIDWIEKQGEQKKQVHFPKFTFDDILALQCCMVIAKNVQEDNELYEQLNLIHNKMYDAYRLGKQGEPNPYSGVSFKYNGHTWGMCARDGGVEILVDGEIKESIKFAHI